MSDELPDSALRRLLGDAESLLLPSESSPAARELPPRYRVVREVGRGGMGIVFEAVDEELHRTVAIKRLDPLFATVELRARLAREAHLLARLSHQAIATLYEAGEGYLVMRFVRGEPLSTVVRRESLSIREVVAWIEGAALAIHSAHQLGIVHRDVKPGNILIEDERPIVTDFGLAKDGSDLRDLSVSGQILGTPGFMAPEQIEGKVVDARTDVYGLGATLYFALTGRPPFRTDAGDDVVGLLKAVVEREPPSPRTIRNSVPEDLERVVMRSLEKEPSRRYESAADLAADLRRWLDDRPVLAQPPSLGYRTKRFVQRRKGIVAVSAIAIFVALSLLLTVLDQRARREAASDALALSQAVDAVFADASLARRRGEMEEMRERLHQGLAACDAFLRVRDVADVHAMRGRLLLALGDAVEARAALDRAIEKRPDLASARLARGVLVVSTLARSGAPEPRDLALAKADLEIACEATALQRTEHLMARAALLRVRGDLSGAKAALSELIELDPTHVDAFTALSEIELQNGESDVALELAMTALDLHRGLGPAYEAKAAKDDDSLARVSKRHAFEAAKERVEGGDDSTGALLELAVARRALDDLDGALSDFSRALAADPSNANATGQRGFTEVRRALELMARGDAKGAEDTLLAAISDFTSAVTLEPTLIGAINDRGVARLQCAAIVAANGRIAESSAMRKDAVADFEAAIRLDPGFHLARRNRAIAKRTLAETMRADEEGSRTELLRAALSDLRLFESVKPADAIALKEKERIEALLSKAH